MGCKFFSERVKSTMNNRNTELPSVYSRTLDLIGNDICCVISDKKKTSRQMVGRLVAFDRHMNIVLTDAFDEVINKTTDSKQRRPIDVVIIRGVNIITMSAFGPIKNTQLSSIKSVGIGQSRAAGRG